MFGCEVVLVVFLEVAMLVVVWEYSRMWLLGLDVTSLKQLCLRN